MGRVQEPPNGAFKDTAESNTAPRDAKPSNTFGLDDDETREAVVQQPMTGLPLYAVLFGICVGSFLMSIDVFIISTVSLSCSSSYDKTECQKHPPDTVNLPPGNPLNNHHLPHHLQPRLVRSLLLPHHVRPAPSRRQTLLPLPPALDLPIFLSYLPPRQRRLWRSNIL
jgi:hypothetical protein